jgi:hypothetical protein
MVEFGRRDGLFLGFDRGLRDVLGLQPLVVRLLRDGLVLDKLRAAIEVALGVRQVGASLRQIGFGLLKHMPVRPAVDNKEDIALLHHLAVGKVDLLEIAADARADFDRIDRNKASDVLVFVDHQFADRLGNRHRGRRRRSLGLLRLALAASGGRNPQNRGRDEKACKSGHRCSPPGPSRRSWYPLIYMVRRGTHPGSRVRDRGRQLGLSAPLPASHI